MATTAAGTPYVEASDLVAGYPAVSLALANHIDGLDGGKVLQVVSVTKVDTYSESITSQTISTSIVTGLTVAIIPTSTSSKIRVDVSTFLSNSGELGIGGFVIRRGSTAIGVAAAASSRARLSAYGGALSNNASDIVALTQTFVDSPSSTSELTYGISLYNRDGSTETAYMNRMSSDFDNAGQVRTVSTITVMEISA